MNSTKGQRVEWIDVAKGVGILLVILGHSVQFGGFLHNLIFSFHMPMFFVLSGMVFRQQKSKEYISKKIKSLIVPYIIFCLVGVILSLLIPVWRMNIGIKSIVKDIYLTNPTSINVSSIWFLVCLFLVSVTFHFIQKFNIKFQYIVVFVCTSVGFIFSYYHNKLTLLPEGRIPFNLDTVMIALAFFAIGYWYKKYIINFKVFCYSCIIYPMAFCLNGRVNLHGLTFHNPVLYILESITGTVIILYFCVKFCEKVKNKKIISFLCWFGKHSLIILGVQALGVRVYILILNRFMKQEFYLYYLPRWHQLISFIFVTVISIWICVLYDYIKSIFKEKR